MLLPASKAAKVTNADSLTGVAPSVPTTVAAVTTPAAIASVPKISPDLYPVPALLISILVILPSAPYVMLAVAPVPEPPLRDTADVVPAEVCPEARLVGRPKLAKGPVLLYES